MNPRNIWNINHFKKRRDDFKKVEFVFQLMPLSKPRDFDYSSIGVYVDRHVL